ncbi:MAG: 23S rRNA (adenine(2503)-C(2))-methyltransferase RlmN [Ignavibacteriaceae bacterium]|nr:23S rRNA (adenine(2503)-C(2))-methyltransferase RlmN [Ignavibacteriaceae bacterium]
MIQIAKKKVLLKGMPLEELNNYFVSIGEPKFRGGQVFNWMYNHLATLFGEMDNLPKLLRSKLADDTIIKTLDFVDSQISASSGTKKFIFETIEHNKIESVIIPEENRTTLCISTQIGCPLDCKFCATGLMGYKKNLTAGEIFDQYLLAAKDYGKDNISNIVYMGMGEPLLNYSATLNSLKIFADELTTGISLKKITVSTAGIAPKIIELADSGLKVKIALSLHSCFEDTRSKIMPVNLKYSLKQNIDAIKYYVKRTGTRVTFEYVMLKGINDRQDDINALAKLCAEIPSKINIIPFNSLKHMNPEGYSAQLEPTPKRKIEDFVTRLRDRNITVIVRYTQGDDIAAACGQLATNYS